MVALATNLDERASRLCPRELLIVPFGSRLRDGRCLTAAIARFSAARTGAGGIVLWLESIFNPIFDL
jgi:hypothetical protein